MSGDFNTDFGADFSRVAIVADFACFDEDDVAAITCVLASACAIDIADEDDHTSISCDLASSCDLDIADEDDHTSISCVVVSSLAIIDEDDEPSLTCVIASACEVAVSDEDDLVILIASVVASTVEKPGGSNSSGKVILPQRRPIRRTIVPAIGRIVLTDEMDGAQFSVTSAASTNVSIVDAEDRFAAQAEIAALLRASVTDEADGMDARIETIDRDEEELFMLAA